MKATLLPTKNIIWHCMKGLPFPKTITSHLALFLSVSWLAVANVMGNDSPDTFEPVRYTVSPLAHLLEKDIKDFSPEQVDTMKTYAVGLWNRIKTDGGRIIKPLQLTPDKVQDFPVALGDIDPGTGTLDYAIVFDRMVINGATGKATLQAFMVFDPPGGGDNSGPMVFMAKNVEFTATGGISSATLTMLGGFTLVQNERFTVNIIGSESGVVMDCDGFKSFDLAGEVLFDKEMIYTPEKREQITGKFRLSAASWDDFLVSFKMSAPFEAKGAAGYTFTVTNATIDMSASRNTTAFPQSYINDTQEYQVLPMAWTGFHISEISVQFPKTFEGQNESPSIGLSNLIIDKHGVSVSLLIENLIPIETGNANGWAFSIDRLGLKVLHNTPVAGSLEGKIQLPVMDTPLNYLGVINTDGSYSLNVSTKETIRFDLWKASSVTLTPESKISLTYANKKFNASALLTGSMNIAAKLSEDANGEVKIPSINFTKLLLQTEKPYLSVEAFGFSENVKVDFKLAGFSTTINDIKVLSDTDKGSDRVGVGFGVKVLFTSISKNSFGADGHLTLFGKMTKDVRGRQRWVYDDIELNELGIEVTLTEFTFNGKLRLFKKTPVYGSGFRGDLILTVPKINLKVEAMALFGTSKDLAGNDFPYWQVDALSTFKDIPIGAGVNLVGFGGGAFERMMMDPKGDPLGMSLSGITYRPDETMGLGLRASMSFTYANKNLVKAKVGLEFAFKKEGGLKYISFDGEAEILAANGDGLGLANIKANLGNALNSINKKNDILSKIGGNSGLENVNGADLLPADSKTEMPGIITAKLHMQYLFDSSTFDANLKINIDVYGLLTGGGYSQMHFSPKKWFIRIGEPTKPLGLVLNLGVIGMSASTYFMVGNEIPDAPAPPGELARILNTSQKDLSYMRDENALGSGSGIAFGLIASLDVNASFLMFYATLKAGVGFDLMLKKYENVRCEGSPDEIGVNGWYSNGQIYAYVSGSVGIRVKLGPLRKDFNILSLGAAALLQAKFPHPFWMRGIVGGYYSILNGKIKGQCRFKFEMGADCNKVQDDPDNRSTFDDVQVIGDITPSNGTEEVTVVSPIRVSFLIPINADIDITDDNGNTEWIRVNLKEQDCKVATTSGTVLPGKWRISEDQRGMDFVTNDPLPAGQTIQVKLVAAFYRNDGNAIKDNQGLPAEETRSVTFKTDTAALVNVPLENIAYSYPIVEQLNFYQDESLKGFIKLLKRQDQIFVGKTNTLTLVNGSEALNAADFDYNDGTINFTFPAGIRPETNYKLVVRSATGNKVLSYDFRTSKYNSLSDKLGGLFNDLVIASGDSAIIENPSEPFDYFELAGKAGMNQLIHFEADISSDNTWWSTLIAPYYESPLFNANRPTTQQEYGSPAVKAVILRQDPMDVSWTGGALPTVKSVSVQYMLPRYTELLTRLTRLKAGNKVCSCKEECDNFTSPCENWIFRPLTPGSYKIKFKYLLPNGSEGRSQGSFALRYNN
jgi:hypothetical protein